MKNKEALIRYEGDTLLVGKQFKLGGIKTNRNRAQFMAVLSCMFGELQIENIREYDTFEQTGRFYGYDSMLKKNRLFTVEELNALFFVMIDSQEIYIPCVYTFMVLCQSFKTLQDLLNNLEDVYYINKNKENK